jgi:DNA-binding NtrC family response regulator
VSAFPTKRNIKMLLYQLMTLYRNEIIAACETELQVSNRAGSLAHYITQHFDSIVKLLEQDSSFGSALPESSLPTHELLGGGAAMARVRLGIDQLSRRSRAPVLFIGEFGVGKRHAAHALHAATYPDGEFFELLGASRLDELERRIKALRTCTSAESTAGLSVYIHELSEAPAVAQLALSQLLPEQTLRFRVSASSSRPLAQAVREGALRSDLAFRFSTTLELPPLRDRKEDLPRLARHFAGLVAKRQGGAQMLFEPSAFERMAEHDWPGNLTELLSLIERLWEEFGPARIGSEEIPELGERQSGAVFHLPRTGIDFAQLERELLTQALTMAESNQTRAATLLGLTRDQLRYRLAKFDIVLRSTRSG